jgi:hypothetical protein
MQICPSKKSIEVTMKVIRWQSLFLVIAIAGAGVLASCGGGSGSAGTPLLGANLPLQSSISLNPSGTQVPSDTPVTVTYHLKDKYGDGVPNELVLFAIGGTGSGTYQCFDMQNVENPGCASTTDGSGNASIILKASVTTAVSIQVTAALVPSGSVTPPISVASAVAAPNSTQASFTYVPKS